MESDFLEVVSLVKDDCDILHLSCEFSQMIVISFILCMLSFVMLRVSLMETGIVGCSYFARSECMC